MIEALRDIREHLIEILNDYFRILLLQVKKLFSVILQLNLEPSTRSRIKSPKNKYFRQSQEEKKIKIKVVMFSINEFLFSYIISFFLDFASNILILSQLIHQFDHLQNFFSIQRIKQYLKSKEIVRVIFSLIFYKKMIQAASSTQLNQVIQKNGNIKAHSYATVLDLEFNSSISKIQIVGPSYISFYEEEKDTIYVLDTQLCAIIANIHLDIKLDFDENYFIDSSAKYLLLSYRGERKFNSQIIEITTLKTTKLENLKVIGIQESTFFALGKGKLLSSDYIQSSIYRIDFKGNILQILKPIVHQYCYYNCFNNILIYQREINQIKLLSQIGKFMNIHLNTSLVELKQSSIHTRLLLFKKAGSAYNSFYLKNHQSVKLIRRKQCSLKDSYQVEIKQKLFICSRQDSYLKSSQSNDSIKAKVAQQLKNESIYCPGSQLRNLQGVITNEKSISIIKIIYIKFFLLVISLFQGIKQR
ncbi:hypothetical protein pb186bvf_016068 [Paramecium bursaria]